MRHINLPALLVITQLIYGCIPVALTAGGVGGGVAASHEMGGMVYRTFSEPLPRVRSATLAAFKHMAINPGKTEKIELGERLLARAGDREVEVELEALTSNTTRMRVTVRRDGGPIVDSATAVEIITQTEQAISHK